MKRLHVSAGLLVLAALIMGAVLACAPDTTPAPAPPSPAAKTPATPPPSATSKPGMDQPARTVAATTPTPLPKTERPYYQGKTIEIIVDQAAGGGTDVMARITAPFLTKYVSGNPRVIIRNQPGVAVAQNVFYERAKRDGSVLLTSASAAIGRQLRKLDIVKYDVTRYKYVGNVARAESVILVRKSVRGTLTDPRGQALVIGTVGGDDPWQAIPMWGREFLGWNVRWLLGFGGTSEVELAFRRGEVDMFGTANAFIINRFQQEGLVESVATLGTLKGGRFLRRPDFPDVPTFEEMLGEKKPSGLPWQAYLAWVGPGLVDKWLVAPPGTPDNVMAILTEAYGKMARDPEFDTVVKKLVSEVYDVGVGQEVENTVKQILSAPPEALDYAVGLQRKFGMIATK